MGVALPPRANGKTPAGGAKHSESDPGAGGALGCQSGWVAFENGFSRGSRAHAREESAEEYPHYPPDLLSCTHNSGPAKARHVSRAFNVDACAAPNSATATFADHPLGSRK
jgi:hypothetical protein